VRYAEELMSRDGIRGVPIVISETDLTLVGIITNRDTRFINDDQAQISSVMTREALVTAPIGTSLEEAERILFNHRIEKLPLVNEQGHLSGLITIKDIEKVIQYQ